MMSPCSSRCYTRAALNTMPISAMTSCRTRRCAMRAYACRSLRKSWRGRRHPTPTMCPSSMASVAPASQRLRAQLRATAQTTSDQAQASSSRAAVATLLAFASSSPPSCCSWWQPCQLPGYTSARRWALCVIWSSWRCRISGRGSCCSYWPELATRCRDSSLSRYLLSSMRWTNAFVTVMRQQSEDCYCLARQAKSPYYASF